MPTGRPSSYKPEYCAMLIEHMASGLSFEAFAGVVKVCKDTLYAWADAHPEFSDAKKEGFAENRLFWEREGLSLRDKEFNSGLWFMNMKNRHGWADKTDVRSENRHRHEVKLDAEIKTLSDGEIATLIAQQHGQA